MSQESLTLPGGLSPIAEEEAKEEIQYRWADFDHANSLFRTFRAGNTSKTEEEHDKTRIVYELSRGAGAFIRKAHLLQWCRKEDFSVCRSMLLNIASDDEGFLSHNFRLTHRDRCYVGSEIASICLADMIYCSVSIKEEHASAILTQVVAALHATSYQNLCYNDLKASNVFISKKGEVPVVQLANFERDLKPRFLSHGNNNPDCQGVGNLAIHMMMKEDPQVPRNYRRTKDEYMNALLQSCSPVFLDFLERCFPSYDQERGSIERLGKHPLLRCDEFRDNKSRFRGPLLPLFHNAVLEAATPRWTLTNRDVANGTLLSR